MLTRVSDAARHIQRSTERFRPSRSAYRRRVARSGPFLLLVIVGFARAMFAFHSLEGRAAVIVVAVALLALVVTMFIKVPRTARLLISPDRVELRGWFVRTRVLAPRDVAMIVTVRTPGVAVMLLDRRGRRLLTLARDLWPVAGLDRLVAAVGVPIEPGSMSSKQLRERYPHAVPWPYAHPLAFALWFTLAWVLLVIIGFVIFTI